jgi:hypothetical protein
MRLDYLTWEASQGRHAKALLLEDSRRRAVMVLRDVARTWVSGWPWRSQALLEGDRDHFVKLSQEDSRWMVRQAERAAGSRRLRIYLPADKPAKIAGFAAGTTRLNVVGETDESILACMQPDRRRWVRRAIKEGFVVTEASTPEEYRRFAELVIDTEARRGIVMPPLPDHPEFGHSWREWQLPWAKLLVAVRGGRVEAGSGFGYSPGGPLELARTVSSRMKQ